LAHSSSRGWIVPGAIGRECSRGLQAWQAASTEGAVQQGSAAAGRPTLRLAAACEALHPLSVFLPRAALLRSVRRSCGVRRRRGR
jgi:hypothetical protein